MYDWKHLFQPLGRDGAKNIFSQIINELINQSVTKVFVEQTQLHRVC